MSFAIVVPERDARQGVVVSTADAAAVAARAPSATPARGLGVASTAPRDGELAPGDDGAAEDDGEAFVRRRGAFAKDLAYMMYGFGDAKEPDPASIELMEDLLVDYLTNVAHRAMEVAERRGRMQTEDLLYVIRNDRKKFARVDELLEMNAKLKDARKNFDLHDPAAVLAQQREEEERKRREAGE